VAGVSERKRSIARHLQAASHVNAKEAAMEEESPISLHTTHPPDRAWDKQTLESKYGIGMIRRTFSSPPPSVTSPTWVRTNRASSRRI
jgi:hypothetical protein